MLRKEDHQEFQNSYGKKKKKANTYMCHGRFRIISFLCFIRSASRAKLQFSPTKPHAPCLTHIWYLSGIISEAKILPDNLPQGG